MVSLCLILYFLYTLYTLFLLYYPHTATIRIIVHPDTAGWLTSDNVCNVYMSRERNDMASCSKTDAAIRDTWSAKHGLRPSPRRNDWHTFMGRSYGKRMSVAADADDALRAGWDDHGEVWIPAAQSGRGFKRPVCYTSQPYGLTDSARQQIDAIAKLHGLRVEINPPAESWYYPGSTWLVILWRPTGSPHGTGDGG